MALGSLSDGAGQLQSAAKRLRQVWDNATTQWNDPVSQKLEAELIDPLLRQVDDTIQAMQALQSVFQKAVRECSEPGERMDVG